MNSLLQLLLGTRCHLCGERTRLPLAAHLHNEHAGDQS